MVPSEARVTDTMVDAPSSSVNVVVAVLFAKSIADLGIPDGALALGRDGGNARGHGCLESSEASHPIASESFDVTPEK